MQTKVRQMFSIYVQREGRDAEPGLRGMVGNLTDAERLLDSLCVQGVGDWGYGYVMHGDEKVSARYREYPLSPPPSNEAERMKVVERLKAMCGMSDADIERYFEDYEKAFKKQQDAQDGD